MISRSGNRGRAGSTRISALSAVTLIATSLGLSLGSALSAPAQAGVKSTMVIEAYSGRVIASHNADAPHPPASLAKMMTLYLTFEAIKRGKLRWNQRVTISRHAAARMPSKLYLKAGQRVTIRNLVYGTAVKSANDAAAALAEAVAGSEVRFAALMTKRARDIGMTNTAFGTASGLPARGQRTTARDMAKLARAIILHYPQHYHFFATKYFKYRRRVYANTNRLLRTHSGVDGMKTGYTNRARYNLVTSAKRGKRRIVTVVLGASSSRTRYRRTRGLLAYAWKHRGKRSTLMAIRKPNAKPQIAMAPRTRPQRDLDPDPDPRMTVAEAEPEADPVTKPTAKADTETAPGEDKSFEIARRPTARPETEPANKTKANPKTERDTTTVAEAAPEKRKVDLSIIGGRAKAAVRVERLDSPVGPQSRTPGASKIAKSDKTDAPKAATRRTQVAVADAPAAKPTKALPRTTSLPIGETKIAARPTLAPNRVIALRAAAQAPKAKRAWTYALQVAASTGLEPARRDARKAFDTLPAKLRQGARIAVIVPEERNKFYRARVIGLSKANAQEACRLLKKKSLRCLAIRTRMPASIAALSEPRTETETSKPVAQVASRHPQPTARRAVQRSKRRAARSDYVIQVGAVSARGRAQRLLRDAQQSLPGAMVKQVMPQILPPSTYSGRLYRVRLAGLSRRDAAKACTILKKKSMDCVQMGGDRIAATRPGPQPAAARRTASAVYAVQVGAASAKSGARRLVRKARRTLPRGLAKQVRPRILSPGTYAGSLYRARLTGFSRQQADKACEILKRKSLDCLPYRVAGEANS